MEQVFYLLIIFVCIILRVFIMQRKYVLMVVPYISFVTIASAYANTGKAEIERDISHCGDDIRCGPFSYTGVYRCIYGISLATNTSYL